VALVRAGEQIKQVAYELGISAGCLHNWVRQDRMNDFWSSTFENWQSEWLQLIFQAILLLGAKHWLFQVDAEDMERMERKVDSIAERLGLDPDESSEPKPEREQDDA
jgi:hypothetical protein